MRPYSSDKALCELSYTCFTGTQVLWQFGETGPKYPKSCWFSLNNSETVKAVTLALCSIH